MSPVSNRLNLLAVYFCAKIERVLAVGCILIQGSSSSKAANNAIQKIGYQPHVEIICSRFKRCNWTTAFVLKEVLRPGLCMDLPE